MSAGENPKDLIERGDRTPTPLGTATWVGLRGLDPFLQYGFLSGRIGTGLITAIGSSVLTQGLSSRTGTILDSLELSPYRLALLGMSTGAFVKHAFWRLFTSQEVFPPHVAAIVSAFNSGFDSINSLLFICAATSPARYSGESSISSNFPGTPLILGSSLFVAGILIETISEVQRALFKRKENNQGKPYTGGLWALSRHPNYLGYALWRGGYALAAGGWIWGAVTAGWFTFDFIARGIPVLEEYCENRVSRSTVLRMRPLLTCASTPTCGIFTRSVRHTSSCLSSTKHSKRRIVENTVVTIAWSCWIISAHIPINYRFHALRSIDSMARSSPHHPVLRSSLPTSSRALSTWSLSFTSLSSPLFPSRASSSFPIVPAPPPSSSNFSR